MNGGVGAKRKEKDDWVAHDTCAGPTVHFERVVAIAKEALHN